jgi:bifunctional UDP-N-acetylglucosamine pyrophosphorylase / glucosamine-1-phosphate N-acetyltransferase
MKVSAVILAAGMSKRMKSAIPKVLHPLLGRPMIEYPLEAVKDAVSERPVIIIGHGSEAVKKTVGDRTDYALQKELLGTGDAVNAARSLLEGKTDLVLVVNADLPMLKSESIKKLVDLQKNNPGPLSLLTFMGDESRGFARIGRSSEGNVAAIIEEKAATQEQLTIKEFNVGIYCFSSQWLWDNLKNIKLSPVGEYYLTDLIRMAADQNLPVKAIALQDPVEAMGINNRIHLAEAESILRKRGNEERMLSGVSILDPERVTIEKSVTIGKDTQLLPDTYLRGNTVIGEGCEIGPNTIITDSKIGDRCKILMSVLEGAVLEDEVSIGPFARLRKGAHLGNGVHMGNFGEIKNSTLARGVKMGHFSYIGDADIGENANIGAGVVTCNFDGEKKNRTEIGANAFIGSDTMLRAPVKIGDGAYTGAGSVVTHDVPAHTIVAGVPARPIRKEKANKPKSKKK